MQSLDKIFQYHAPTCAQVKVYERLREAFLKYAEDLTTERILDDRGELILELAYEDMRRTLDELVPMDSDGYEQALKLIDQAYDIARDPNRAIVLLVQGASMYSNAAVALSKD
jgi:tetratricopeptide (TPR) repeat protein